MAPPEPHWASDGGLVNQVTDERGDGTENRFFDGRQGIDHRIGVLDEPLCHREAQARIEADEKAEWRRGASQ
jgi:hypothetical protein